MEVFTPPKGDFQLHGMLNGKRILTATLKCSAVCPSSTGENAGFNSQDCNCSCSGSCNCETCTRSAGSEVLRVKGGIKVGHHGIRAVLIDPKAAPGAERPEVLSYFNVVENWLDAFASLAPKSLPVPTPNISGPKHRLPGLLYSMLPYQASGAAAFWPGLTVIKPVHAQVFSPFEEVQAEVDILDMTSDGMQVQAWIQIQVDEKNDDQCNGSRGCAVTARIPLEHVPFLSTGVGSMSQDPRVECSDAGCDKQIVKGLILMPGTYRMNFQLKDKHGRAVGAVRERAFSVREEAAAGLIADGPRSHWYCPAIHCQMEDTEAPTSGPVADAITSAKAAMSQLAGKRPALVALVVYEWPPMLGANGDADRARQLVMALDRLGFEVHFVARMCMGYHGDYMTMSPSVVGPKMVCELADADIPAYLLEFKQIDFAFLVSTFWYYPAARSIPEMWIPFIRESDAGFNAKITVMADVVTAPFGLGLGDTADVDKLHSHGAQLMGFAAADAVAFEVAEDAGWINDVLPELPTFPVRFASTIRPTTDAESPGFMARKGMVWVGSAHFDNAKAVEWVIRKVLPLIQAKIGNEASILTVVGRGTDSLALNAEGVKVLGPVDSFDDILREARVCLSPTVVGLPRFQTKHLQALARGVPVVTTQKGVAGYHLTVANNGTCNPAPKGAVESGPEISSGDCGWKGVSSEHCIRMGCCYDDSSSPSCVFKSMTKFHSGQGLVAASPGQGRLEKQADGSDLLVIGDWEAELLAAEVAELLTDEAKWAEESQGARDRVNRHFHQSEVDREVAELVLGMVGDRAR